MIECALSTSGAINTGVSDLHRHHHEAPDAERQEPRLSFVRVRDASQQPRAAWTGGHGTDPYEQNTQQSPGLGRNSDLHSPHS